MIEEAWKEFTYNFDLYDFIDNHIHLDYVSENFVYFFNGNNIEAAKLEGSDAGKFVQIPLTRLGGRAEFDLDRIRLLSNRGVL